MRTRNWLPTWPTIRAAFCFSLLGFELMHECYREHFDRAEDDNWKSDFCFEITMKCIYYCCSKVQHDGWITTMGEEEGVCLCKTALTIFSSEHYRRDSVQISQRDQVITHIHVENVPCYALSGPQDPCWHERERTTYPERCVRFFTALFKIDRILRPNFHLLRQANLYSCCSLYNYKLWDVCGAGIILNHSCQGCKNKIRSFIGLRLITTILPMHSSSFFCSCWYGRKENTQWD